MAGFFERLKNGLSKTKDGMVRGLDETFRGSATIDEDFYDELEENLILGDVGVTTSEKILERLREQVQEQKIREPQACRELLIQDIREQMTQRQDAYEFERHCTVIFMIGVNGVGKTTTVGKLAGKYAAQGKKVLVAAADTYRAAAQEQLAEWTRRAGAQLITGREGADPASVLYDAVQQARSQMADFLIVDTAGRLHNKKNLMEELAKMHRIIMKELPGYCHENFIVLDSTTGQNALSQARQFSEVTDLTGNVLTKLDGTARGGIAIAIVSELKIPVKYIGVGESIDDLERFDPDEYVNALFDNSSKSEEGEQNEQAE